MADPISAVLLAASTGGSLGFGGLTTLGAISSVAPYALLGGALVGGSLLLNVLGSKQHTDNQQTVKQSIPPRQRVYGRALLAGAYFFFAANGPHLVSGFVLCEGPIDSFAQLRFDNDSVQGPADYGAAIYPWYQYVQFGLQYGNEDQGRQSLISDTTQDLANWWTADHRLRGLATLVIVCTLPPDPEKNFSKFFPGGTPQMLALVRGSRLYDPRTGGVSWTANAALVILDYLTHPRGLALPRARLDLASFAAMASAWDGLYEIHGTYQLDEQPKDVLTRFLACCDGELYPLANGTVGLRGGVWTAPSVTITPDMILDCQAQRGVDRLAAFNQLKIQITDPTADFQLTEIATWNDVAAQTASGEVLPQQLDLPMVHSYTQARRLAKIVMAKGNPAWQLTLTTNLAALDALGERIVRVVYPDLGIDGTFFVNAFAVGEDGATCSIGLGALDATAYGLADGEPGDPPVGPTPPPPAYVPQAVAGLTLTIDTKTFGAGTRVASIKAVATPPIDNSLLLAVQYRLLGDAAWIDMPVVDNVAYIATSPYLQDGTYEVQAAYETFGGRFGPWTAPAQIRFVSGALGPVATALAAGASLDFGVLDQAVSARDDFGLLDDPASAVIDMGMLVG